MSRRPKRKSSKRSSDYQVLEPRKLLAADGFGFGGGDPDDQISEALVGGNNTTQSGTIDSDVDVDMWEFFQVAGSRYAFDIDIPNQDLDSVLRLFDGNGMELAVSDDDVGPGNEPHFRESYIEWTVPYTGDFYVGVSAYPNFNYDPVTGDGDSGNGIELGDYELNSILIQTEPDDNDDTIAEATPISNGSQTSGEIEFNIDVDMYSIDVPQGSVLSIDVDNANLDLDSYVRLFDSAGNELASNDNGDAADGNEPNALDAFLEYSVGAPGTNTYYIGISNVPNTGYNPVAGWGDHGGTTAGIYDLNVSFQNDLNDSISEASNRTSFTNTVASINPGPDDVDMWRYDLVAGENYTFDLDNRTGSTLDSYLRLFDAAGNELLSQDNRVGLGTELSNLESFLHFSPTVSGSYYVGVSQPENSAYDPNTGLGDVSTGTTGTYELGFETASDVNDTIAEATTRYANLPTTTAFVSPSWDVDLWRIDLDAGEVLKLDVDVPNQDLDSYLRLFDEFGNELAANDDAVGPGNEPHNLESYLEYTSNFEQSVYVGVSAHINRSYDPISGGGEVWSDSEGQYQLLIDIDQVQDVNDTIAEAASRYANLPTQTAFVNPHYDIDLWRVDLNAGDELEIDIDVPDQFLDSYIRLFDANGNELAANDNGVGPGNEPSSLESYMTFVAQSTGDYYVGITAAPNTTYDPLTGDGKVAGNSDGFYEMHLDVTPASTGVVAEAGFITATHVIQTIHLNNTFVDPVIILGPMTENGGDPAVTRVLNVTSNSFDVHVEEYNYLNGIHNAAETFSYMVIEAGTHTLPDGTLIEAGNEILTNDTWTSVSFGNSMTNPVVLSHVNSENGDQAVKTRTRNVSSTGFDFRMQEEEGANQLHAAETVSWFAIESNVTSPDFVAGTVSGVTHNAFTASWAPSLNNGLFFANMQTQTGADNAAIRMIDQQATTATFYLEEETSADTETNHNAAETVGVVVLPADFFSGSGGRPANGGSLVGSDGNSMDSVELDNYLATPEQSLTSFDRTVLDSKRDIPAGDELALSGSNDAFENAWGSKDLLEDEWVGETSELVESLFSSEVSELAWS